MPALTPQQSLALTIKQGAVYYFTSSQLSSSEPHYFVVLNKSPIDDPIVLLGVATTKVRKKLEWVNKVGLPTNTIVIVRQGKSAVFSKETAFNCNQPTEMLATDFFDKCKFELFEYKGEIEQDILVEVIHAVQGSPMVTERIKELL